MVLRANGKGGLVLSCCAKCWLNQPVCTQDMHKAIVEHLALVQANLACILTQKKQNSTVEDETSSPNVGFCICCPAVQPHASMSIHGCLRVLY